MTISSTKTERPSDTPTSSLLSPPLSVIPSIMPPALRYPSCSAATSALRCIRVTLPSRTPSTSNPPVNRRSTTARAPVWWSATCPVHSWHPSVSLMLRAPVSPLRAGPTAVPAPSTPEICATAITFLTGRSPVMFPASKSISRRATAGSLWTSTKPTPPRSPLNPPRTW